MRALWGGLIHDRCILSPYAVIYAGERYAGRTIYDVTVDVYLIGDKTVSNFFIDLKDYRNIITSF